MLLARITPPPTLDDSTPVALKADVTWLVCEKECIPGETSLTLALPIAGPGSAARRTLQRPPPSTLPGGPCRNPRPGVRACSLRQIR
jgi:DsbC/DsbD-like thiol-disulfide interchange protein